MRHILLNAIRRGRTAFIVFAVSTAIPAGAAMADSNYFGGGAGTFERVMRDYGSQVGQGARHYGGRALDTARSVSRYAPGLKPKRTPKGWRPTLSPWGYLVRPNCVGENC